MTQGFFQMILSWRLICLLLVLRSLFFLKRRFVTVKRKTVLTYVKAKVREKIIFVFYVFRISRIFAQCERVQLILVNFFGSLSFNALQPHFLIFTLIIFISLSFCLQVFCMIWFYVLRLLMAACPGSFFLFKVGLETSPTVS